jgi:hypothetical protein
MQYVDGIKYRHEGGYSYLYEDNVVYKYPFSVMPEYLSFSSHNNFAGLNDFALTPEVFNKIIEECKYHNNWFPENIRLALKTIDLNFKLPVAADTTGLANLLFRNVETGKIVFPNYRMKKQQYQDILENVTYDVILLYNSGNYVRYDSLTMKSGAYIELNMADLYLHKKDSVSQKWLKLNSQYIIPCEDNDYKPPFSFRGIFYLSSGRNLIRGNVKDENGETLIGTIIQVKDSQYGVVTDNNGDFEIALDDYRCTLIFSYIGYESKEVEVTAGTEINIVLTEDMAILEEVMVVAYGTIRKQSLVSSVAGSVAVSDMREPQSPPEDDEDDTESKSTVAEDKLYSELLQLNGLRSNFSDVGFWEPRLYTDKKGTAGFTVTFPDNITQWNTVVYAMNRRLKTGTARKYIKSYKPLMSELKNPQFLIVGDSAYYASNIRNYTADKEIAGKAIFSVGQDTVMKKDIRFGSSYQDKMLVTPLVADSVTATYMFVRNDGYSDGEKRTIPVFRQGTEIADGTLEFLQNGDKKEINAGKNEEINVIIASNSLNIYVDAANYLGRYRYACNEQLASKLTGLLNIKLYQQYIGKKFRYDKDVNKIIKRLTDNRNDKNLWSWWGRSPNTSYWMSAHILRALRMAKKAGYTVDIRLENAYDYIDIINYRNISLADIEILNIFSESAINQNYKAAVDMFDSEIARLERIADSIARETKQENRVSYLKEKLLLLEIRQNQNLDYSPEMLTKYLKKDVYGETYCDDGIKRYWHMDNLVTTLIAYRIVGKDSTLQHLKTPMQMYILRTKQNGWNTYQASSAVMTVLPDLLNEYGATKDNPTVVLTGKENKIIDEFPYTLTVSNGEKLGVEKKSGIPVIYSEYKSKYVTEENKGDAFEVFTYFDQNEITAGKKIKLIANVHVKQTNAEYVMIEIPVPANCSYASKNNYYGYYNNRNGETYREYFKDKVAVFCERLPVGQYSYEIELLPRYTGGYTLNPAKVEMMYFPVINANNEMRKVKIGE